MKKALLLYTIFFCLSASSQLLFKLSSDTLKTFVYTDGDEFNTPSLNTNYWRSAWTKVNMAQDFRYNDANVKFENGLLNLVMLKQDSVYRLMPHEIDSAFIKEKKIAVQNYTYHLNYSAGMIISQKKFHYGLYELKFKVEEGKGVWPAFWFFGGKKNDEIDAFELKGEKNNVIHVDMHCPKGCDRGYKNKLGISTSYGAWLPVSHYLHEGFNILSIEWKPTEILWYVNGYPLAYFKGAMPNPMNLFLNTQIAANGRAFGPGPDTTTIFPNNFYVDYFRVWQEIAKDSIPFLQKNYTIARPTTGDYAAIPVTKKGLTYIRKKFKAEEGLVSMSLSEKRILTVLVMGKLSTSSTVVIQGKNKKYSVQNLMTENTFDLAEEEEQLELIVKTKTKEYRQSFRIQNQIRSPSGK